MKAKVSLLEGVKGTKITYLNLTSLWIVGYIFDYFIVKLAYNYNTGEQIWRRGQHLKKIIFVLNLLRL